MAGSTTLSGVETGGMIGYHRGGGKERGTLSLDHLFLPE